VSWRESPECKILFLTGNDDPEIAEEASAAGADGYVIKIDAKPELHAALGAAVLGERYVSKRLARVRRNCTLDDRRPGHVT